MESLFAVCLTILAVILIICVQYARRKNAKCSKSIVRLLDCALCGMIAYIVYSFSYTKNVALFADDFYFIATGWMAYFLLKFVTAYSDVHKRSMYLDYCFISVISVDSALLFANYWTKFFYDLEKIEKNGTFYYMERYTRWQYLHVGLCYILLFSSLAILVYKLMISPTMYKIKYLAILIPEVLLMTFNASYYILQLRIDLSISFYALLGVPICYFALKAIPEGLVDKVQSYMAENIKQGLLCFDIEDHCIYANNAITLGKKGCDDRDIELTEKYFLDLVAKFHKYGIEKKDWQAEVMLAGEKYYMSYSFLTLRDQKKRYMGCFFVVNNNTEDMKKIEEESYKASHDALTGFYNRENFFKEVDKVLEQSNDKPRYLIASDIKDFKVINNVYGEQVGDNLLSLQASLIKKIMSEDSIGGRIMGDKFAFLIDKKNFDKTVIKKGIDEINASVGQKRFSVHYHIGVYDITGIKASAMVLYNRVNLAIAMIHDDYQKIFVNYDTEMMERILREKELVTEFDKAVEERQFQMYLQPQINTEGEMVGAEALVRWQHSEKGLLFPGAFIDVFEKANIIHRLDKEIWRQAAEKLAEWKKKGITDKHISVNISTKDFYYLDIYAEFTSLIYKYAINPKNLKLEITESAVMENKECNFEILAKLRKFGFDLELDDFGSGYSSLNMLKSLKVDVLKIDRMFLEKTDNEEDSEIILDSVISMAKRLGMTIVTEGVEKEEQVVKLRDMGTDLFQGYFYDKPLPIGQFEEKYFIN